MEVHTSMNASAASDVTTTIFSLLPDLFTSILRIAGVIVLILLSLLAAYLLSCAIPGAACLILGLDFEQTHSENIITCSLLLIISICVITQFANLPSTLFEFAVENWKVLYGIAFVSFLFLALLATVKLIKMLLAGGDFAQLACGTEDLEQKNHSADTGLLNEVGEPESTTPSDERSSRKTFTGEKITPLPMIFTFAFMITAMSFGPWSPFNPANTAAILLSATLLAKILVFIIVTLLLLLSTAFTALFAGAIYHRNLNWDSHSNSTDSALLISLCIGIVLQIFFWKVSFFDTVDHPDGSVYWELAQLVVLFLLLEGGVLASVLVGKGLYFIWRRLRTERGTTADSPRSVAMAEG